MNPRRLFIVYSIPVEFEIPESFPLTAEEIQKIAEWKLTDWRDGRYPFSTELMSDGASRAAQHHVADAVFNHYCRRVEAAFGSDFDHIEARNKLIERCLATVKSRSLPEHGVTVEARIYAATVLCPGCGQETIVSRYKECVCGATLPASHQEGQ
jgi:hypothetical protein